MTARVLTGSKQEIARQLADIDGDVREAIVFVEEPAGAAPPPPPPPAAGASADELFAEMEPYTVNVAALDDSRDAIYDERVEGE